ncbi:membrane protein [Corynebacterium stationis]|uniref:LapA family protein n=1 Tax=Corynebacterium stationis TaxID=1705 RepID=UPI0009505F9E|nr:lipopolysaccharide assembly protein LapA domain-containing protein [Corynebacterium stationis]APT94785.1 membrane protein [Corynebacterium stationis]
MTTPNEEFEYTEIESATGETAPVQPTSVEPTPAQPTKVKGSIAASTWIALIIGFLLLILLIVFILQNQQSVELNIFAWSGAFPAGIAFLLFAIGGALFMALIGVWRMLELRRQIKRLGKK